MLLLETLLRHRSYSLEMSHEKDLRRMKGLTFSLLMTYLIQRLCVADYREQTQ